MGRIALQFSMVPTREIDLDFDACDHAGIVPSRFHLIPFSDEIRFDRPEDEPTGDSTIPFGSTKLVKLWLADKLPAGWTIFYSEAGFDQRNYSAALGDHCLNHQARYSTVGAEKNLAMKETSFIKPTNDLKAFAGMVIDRHATLGSALAQITTDSSLSDSEPILIAPLAAIVQEFRCWVVDGKMIEASVYKEANRVWPRRITTGERAILKEAVEPLHQLWAPARAYVVDLAQTRNDDLKVVEYNCFNCSGRYAADRATIFRAAMEASPD